MIMYPMNLIHHHAPVGNQRTWSYPMHTQGEHAKSTQNDHQWQPGIELLTSRNVRQPHCEHSVKIYFLPLCDLVTKGQSAGHQHCQVKTFVFNSVEFFSRRKTSRLITPYRLHNLCEMLFLIIAINLDWTSSRLFCTLAGQRKLTTAIRIWNI